VEFAVGTKARVVDQQSIDDFRGLSERKNLLRTSGAQIRDADERTGTLCLREFRRDADKPVTPPRRQPKFVPPAAQSRAIATLSPRLRRNQRPLPCP